MLHLNVIEDVTFALEMQGILVAKRRKTAQELIALMDLNGRETSFPNQLSGGQRQSVGIARALAINPEL